MTETNDPRPARPTVAAVVLTYNRPAMLRECLGAVLGQTRPPDEVIVVDNASTDETPELLEREFPGVQVLRLARNSGSAGGYHAGMRAAFERGFDWIWTMDDDGVPTPDCLERLLDVSDETLAFRGPLVVAREDPSVLAFGHPLNGRHQPLVMDVREARSRAVDGLLRGTLNPFNGAILHRDAVARLGLPIPEMFIWGEEVEYLFRLDAGGVRRATVVDADFRHPRDRMSPRRERLLGREVVVYHVDNPFRNYLIVRNFTFVARRYKGWPAAAAHAAKYVVYHLSAGRVRAAVAALEAGLHGAVGWLGGHRRRVRRGDR